MSQRRRTPDALIAAVVFLSLVLAALGAYVGGYFALSVLRGPPSHDILVRDFPHRWQAEIYSPLVKVESLVRGPIEPAWGADP
jgi:hypothetical protein